MNFFRFGTGTGSNSKSEGHIKLRNFWCNNPYTVTETPPIENLELRGASLTFLIYPSTDPLNWFMLFRTFPGGFSSRSEMCILFIKLLKSAKPGEFKLILASNRDEFFKRPGKTAHFWDEDTNIFGGRDMTENKQGGTWLAMSRNGKLGVLLNVTEGDPNPLKLGRGFLVADYLKNSIGDREYLERIMENGHRYNKFHLVTASFGPQPGLLHYTNSSKGSGITEIQNEVFAVGNSSLEAPLQKVTKGKLRFEEICAQFGKLDQKENLIQQLLSFLKWEEKHYPDKVLESLPHLPFEFKPNYSAVFVKVPELSYGTRTHTIILVDWKDKAEFYEWALEEPITPQHMEWKKTFEQFDLMTDTVYRNT